jgi:hypothetical protein
MESDKGEQAMAQPALDREDIGELRFTVHLNGRAAELEALAPAEAQVMFELGFRFSIFQPEMGEYQLSRPYKLAHNLDRDTLTIVQ